MRHYDNIAYHSKDQLGDFAGLQELLHAIDYSQSHHVLQRVAELNTFPHLPSPIGQEARVCPPIERCYTPYKFEFHAGASRTEAAVGHVGNHYKALESEAPVDLRHLPETARDIFLHRTSATQLNDRYGNTPALFLQSGRIDLAQLTAGVAVRGHDDKDLMSSIKSFGDTMQKIQDDVEWRRLFTDTLLFGDMKQVDAQAAMWEKLIMPLVVADARPAVEHQFLVDAEWCRNIENPSYRQLYNSEVKNNLAYTLNSAVVKMTLTTDSLGSVNQYYYFHEWSREDARRLIPHYRWFRFLLPFEKTIRVKIDIYAQEGTYISTNVSYENPNPIPESQDLREQMLRKIKLYEPVGSLLIQTARRRNE